ncbi:MAG: ATP synthase F1 subunit epsilon [Bacilli bacterium]|nr:ATP synthase F1 subunit epsilon [Bacilli bacterium]
MSTFLLEIFTPFGKYFDRYVEELVIQTDDYVLGILPNHTPLVSKVKISKMYIIQNGDKKCYAIGEGLLNISKDGVTLLLESIESKNDIDIDRAKEAKKRAEQRLATLVNIDVERAQRALNRANNRISVYENDD